MYEFFQGWRRKAGVVTLVVALASIGIWLRSLVISDYVAIGQHHSLFTTTQGIGWQEIEIRDGVRFSSSWEWDTYLSRDTPLRPDDWRDMSWNLSDADVFQAAVSHQWKWLGFTSIASPWIAPPDPPPFNTTGPWVLGKVSYIICPHWFCTLTITLLSAYLILWKPGKRPPTASQTHA
jgi:hypothetical protein